MSMYNNCPHAASGKVLPLSSDLLRGNLHKRALTVQLHSNVRPLELEGLRGETAHAFRITISVCDEQPQAFVRVGRDSQHACAIVWFSGTTRQISLDETGPSDQAALATDWTVITNRQTRFTLK